MNVDNRFVLKFVFKLICIVCASSMIGYWLYKFEIEDRDVGVVDYVKIDESSDIPLPVVSLCIENPFLEARLLEYIPNLNAYDYPKFLRGLPPRWAISNVNLTRIEYSNVTLNLDDYVHEVRYELRNESGWKIKDIFYHGESFAGFTELSGTFEKCFEIRNEVQNYLIQNVLYSYNLSGIMKDIVGETKISVSIHNSGQYFLRPKMSREVKLGSASQNFVLEISDIEVITSRNSRNRNCTPFDKDMPFDEMVKIQHIKTNKC